LLIEGLSRFGNPGPTLDRVISWLASEGLLLVQIACHWRDSYEFEPGDENGWMLPEVPDGALLPGQQYLYDLTEPHRLHARWELSGEHYQRTACAWLRRLDANREQLLAVLAAHGVPHPRRTLRAWRQALLALEDMYGFREGQEWCTAQLLLGSSRP
jgi:cyclopropane-fatty-acyl-phospholipid synthase